MKAISVFNGTQPYENRIPRNQIQDCNEFHNG